MIEYQEIFDQSGSSNDMIKVFPLLHDSGEFFSSFQSQPDSLCRRQKDYRDVHVAMSPLFVPVPVIVIDPRYVTGKLQYNAT